MKRFYIYISPYKSEALEPEIYFDLPTGIADSRSLYKLDLKNNEVLYTFWVHFRDYDPELWNYGFNGKAYFFVGEASDKDKILEYSREKIEELTEATKSRLKLVDKKALRRKELEVEKKSIEIRLKNIEEEIKKVSTSKWK